MPYAHRVVVDGYDGLVNVGVDGVHPKRRVLPGDSAYSCLMDERTGLNMCFGAKRPKTASISQAQLASTQAWIDSGARP